MRKALGIRYNGRGKMRGNVSFLFRSRDFLAVHRRGVANLYFTFTPDSFGVFTAIDGKEVWNYQHYFLDPSRDTDHLDPKEILQRAMGAPFEIELLAEMHWHHHQSVARRWRDGRVFLVGDAAHLFAPTGGVGMNTGIGDACDLAWKLDAVLSGWGGPALLDSYEIERKPIAIRNSLISAGNSDKIDMVMDETPSDIDRDDAQGDVLRDELARKIRWLARQFNSAGTHLGYRYVGSPVIASDGTREPPDDTSASRAVELARQPRAACVACRRRSTLDLFGDGFVLLQFGPADRQADDLIEAAAACGMRVRVEHLDDEAVGAIYARPFVLVRPDGHVAWRGDALPAAPGELLDLVRGAGAQ